MTKTLTEAEYIRCGREVDARVWPVVDRILARLGMTREQAIAAGRALQPAPAPAGEPEAAPAPTPGATPRRKAQTPRSGK